MQNCERSEFTISTISVSDGMIAVTVADTGPGIASDVMSKLFQPFVTTETKGMGQGCRFRAPSLKLMAARLCVKPALVVERSFALLFLPQT
jgi:C4-dicarboxylate-specific signal transduction histidine kinase